MKKTRGVWFVLAGVVSCGLFGGCTVEDAPIRIGTNAWPPCEIWSIAEEQQLFGDTSVEIVRYSAWRDNMSSLYKGDIDITHATYFNAVYYHDKGQEGEIILSSDVIEGSDGLAIRSDLEQPANLAGRTIAVEIDTDEHFLLIKALEEFNLTEGDVTIISTTSEEAANLFIAGEVDACFTYDPFLRNAAEKGGGKIVWTTENLPGYMVDVLVARTEVVEERVKDLRNIISGWYRAQDYIDSNEDEAFQIMAVNARMDPEDFGYFYKSFTFFTAAENREMFSSTQFTERLEEMNEFLFQHDAIREKAEVANLFTDEVITGIRE